MNYIWFDLLCHSIALSLKKKVKITIYCCNTSTYQLGSLLASQRSGVVSLIPLPVREAVNEDDAVLHQGLGSDQLVVRGIVDHVDDPGLARAACVQASAISWISFILALC